MLRRAFRTVLPSKLLRYSFGRNRILSPRMSSQFSHKNVPRVTTSLQTRNLVSSEITDGNHFDEMEPNLSEIDEIIDHNIENIRDCLYPNTDDPGILVVIMFCSKIVLF